MNKVKRYFVVTKDGKDCRLALRSETGLGSALSPKKGLLVPCADGDIPAVFSGAKSADRAISRLQRTVGMLKGTLVEGMPRLKEIMTPGKFDVRTFSQ